MLKLLIIELIMLLILYTFAGWLSGVEPEPKTPQVFVLPLHHSHHFTPLVAGHKLAHITCNMSSFQGLEVAIVFLIPTTNLIYNSPPVLFDRINYPKMANSHFVKVTALHLNPC